MMATLVINKAIRLGVRLCIPLLLLMIMCDITFWIIKNDTESKIIIYNPKGDGMIDFNCKFNVSISRNVTTETRTRISAIEWKTKAELFYGNLPRPSGYPVSILNEENVKCMLSGTWIFVDTTDLFTFFIQIFPLIKVKFTLVSGDSDDPVPSNIMGILPNYTDYISSEKVIKWYGMNCDHNHFEMKDKFQCIPLGIRQIGGYNEMLDLVIAEKHEKLHTLYMNFEKSTNPKEREPLYSFFNNTDWVFKRTERIFPIDYLRDMSKSKFILSPHGAGLDCYRTYEALYLGCIPIVKTSSLDEIYKDLPVIIVQDWSNVTLQLLSQKYLEYETRDFSSDKLYMEYWTDLFQKGRERGIAMKAKIKYD